MNQPKSIDAFASTLMILLCLCWGAQQVVMKSIASEMLPVVQVTLRSGISALLIFLLMLWKREKLQWNDGTLLPGILAGIFFCGEFLSVSLGLAYTSASHMSVFLYTAPLFTAIGLHWLVPSERMGLIQWLGIFLSFLGVTLIFAHGFSSGSADWKSILLGDGLGILAGLSWALTTLVIKRSSLAEATPAKTLLYQLVVTTILLSAVSSLEQAWVWPPYSSAVWLSLFYQSVIVAFLSFFAWFWLLRRYLASRLSVFSFLTPIFGMIFGVWILQEPWQLSFVGGAMMILTGIALVNRKSA